MFDNDSTAVRSGEWVGPEEARRSEMRRRGETAQRIADKLGVSVDRVYAEWRRAGREQIEWAKALAALGYKPGDDPVAFLRRVNASREERKGPNR
jgi:hypothetical protein